MKTVFVAPGPYPLQTAVIIPADAEGIYGLCNDCAAVVLADSRAEVDALWEIDVDRSRERPAELACPNCGNADPAGGVCFCFDCIHRAES